MTPTSAAHDSKSGWWFLFGIGISLAIIGGLFVFLLGRSFIRAREMRAWPRVPCVILSSSIEERLHDAQSPIEYRHDLLYGYDWHGQSFTSDRFSLRGSVWSSRKERALANQQSFPVGMMSVCWVSPAQPNFAVLKPDSLAPGYSIWFPGLFVIGGLGIAYRALRRHKSGSMKTGSLS